MNTPEREESGWESAHFRNRQLFQISAGIQLLFHERMGVRELNVKRLSTFFFFLTSSLLSVVIYSQSLQSFVGTLEQTACQRSKESHSQKFCRLRNLQKSMIVCFFVLSEAIYMAIFKLNNPGCGANTVQALLWGAFRCHTFLSRGYF